MRELTEQDKALIVDGIPNANLVLFCPALHGLGSTLFDRSQYANHGAITGATWKRTPRELPYLDFDGSTGRVRIAHNASLSLSQWTILAWIKLDVTGSERSIVSKDTTGSKQNSPYFFQVLSSNNLRGVVGDGVTPRVIDGATALAAGKYYLVGFTFTQPNAVLYLNDAVDKTATLNYTPVQNTASVDIGRWNVWIPFDGAIVLPRFISVGGWTLAQQQAVYSRGSHLFGV